MTLISCFWCVHMSECVFQSEILEINVEMNVENVAFLCVSPNNLGTIASVDI